MIILDVKEYCHNCPKFIPIASVTTIKSKFPSDKLDTIDTTIRCRKYEECNEIGLYIINWCKEKNKSEER